jgi:hypothetical protein
MKRALVASMVGGIGILAMAAGSWAAAAKLNVKPGQWQTTIKIEMPGMPMALPPFTTESCITEKDLVPGTQQQGQDCKVLSQKITGNTVEWSIECKDGQGGSTTGKGKITYAGESFDGAMDLTASGMQIKYTLHGKRIGDCKK